MNKAPAVTYLVGPSVFLRALAYLLFLLGALSTLALLTQTPLSIWRWALSLSVLAGCGCLAWSCGRHEEQGRLVWDRQIWHFVENSESTGDIQVRLDWQSGLLLTFDSAGQRTRWLWLAQASSPRLWPALRRAVWAPRAVTNPAQAGAKADEFLGSRP